VNDSSGDTDAVAMDDTETNTTPSDDRPRFDLAPAVDETPSSVLHCEDLLKSTTDVRGHTPRGEFVATMAAFGWDVCEQRPRIVLFADVPAAFEDAVGIRPPSHERGPRIWTGMWDDAAVVVHPDGAMDVGVDWARASLSMWQQQEGSGPLEVSVSIEDHGWTLNGRFEALYCKALDNNDCWVE